MAVDVSMYNQNQNPLSPVDMATKFATMQNAVNQNKMFPGQLQLQQQSILSGAQGIERNNIAIDEARMKYMNDQYTILNGELGALAAKKDLSQDDIVRTGQRLVNAKIITPEMFSSTIKSMPTDQTQLPGYMQQLLTTTLSAQEKANMAFGSPSLVNTGQGLRPVTVSPTKGVRDMPGGTIRVMPTESEMNQPTVIGVDNRGRPVQGTKRQFLQNATGVDPITQQPMEGSDPRIASSNSNIPNKTSSNRGIVTSLAPGEGETMQQSATAWQKARQYVAGDEATPNGSAQRLMTLNKALEGLRNSPETGPGSETYNQVRSFILTLSPEVGKLIGIDPDKVASYDEANKYLIANASQTAGAMGSDSRLASALSGNANTHISNLAAQDVVKANIALERAKMAQVSLFQSLGGNPEEFSDWAAQINRRIDPRAFAIDLMDTDKRKKMLSSMNATDKKKFIDSIKIGVATGVVDPSIMGNNNNGK